MRREGEEPEPPYTGPFVTIRPEGTAYTVAVEPTLPTGGGSPRIYGSKIEAFSAASELWSAHRLPCCDLTQGRIAAHYDK